MFIIEIEISIVKLMTILPDIKYKINQNKDAHFVTIIMIFYFKRVSLVSIKIVFSMVKLIIA